MCFTYNTAAKLNMNYTTKWIQGRSQSWYKKNPKISI